MSPEVAAQWLAIASFVIALLLSLVAWLASRQITAIETDIKTSRAERDKEVTGMRLDLAAEREARNKDRHDARDQMNAQGLKLQAFMLDVAKECINAERLEAVMQPMQTTLAEIKADQRRIFQKLDEKVDKA